MDRTKRLLLIGTSLIGLVLAAVWLVGGGADGTPDDPPGGAASGGVGATSTSNVSNEDSGSTDDSRTVTERESAETAGTTEEGSDELALTTEELSMEACEQFQDGHTVADFAEWFEGHVQGGDAERTELFRAVLTRALTEECPGVVPDN